MGWRAKVQVRENGTMIAARRGAANKIGYIAAHSAIVLICVGGLLDGDLIVRAQMLLQGKSVYTGGGMMRDVPARFRLGPGTPTFRANLVVPEGSQSGTAVIGMQDGVVLQDLPFDVELKKFIVEYYDDRHAQAVRQRHRDPPTATPASPPRRRSRSTRRRSIAASRSTRAISPTAAPRSRCAASR